MHGDSYKIIWDVQYCTCFELFQLKDWKDFISKTHFFVLERPWHVFFQLNLR